MAFILGRKLSLESDNSPVSAGLPGAGGLYRSSSLRGEKSITNVKNKSNKKNSVTKTTEEAGAESSIVMVYKGPKKPKVKSTTSNITKTKSDTQLTGNVNDSTQNDRLPPLSKERIVKTSSTKSPIPRTPLKKSNMTVSAPSILEKIDSQSSINLRSSSSRLVPRNSQKKKGISKTKEKATTAIVKKMENLAVSNDSSIAEEEKRNQRLLARAEIIVLNRVAAFIENVQFEKSQTANGV